MKGSQQSRLSALHGIRRFMDDHADALGPVNQSASRAALDDVLTEIEQGAAAQDSAETNATSGTQEKNELRDELRQKHMAPIAAIARATLAHTPRIAKLRLPGARVSDRSLIAAATSMADVSADYVQVFTDEKLPPEFIADLREATQKLSESMSARDGFVRQLTEATNTLDTELVRAKNVVQVLNTLVRRQLHGNTGLLSGWRQAKHPKAKPGVPRGTTRTPAAATPPVAPGTAVAVTTPTAPATSITSTPPADVPVEKAA